MRLVLHFSRLRAPPPRLRLFKMDICDVSREPMLGLMAFVSLDLRSFPGYDLKWRYLKWRYLKWRSPFFVK